MFPALKFGGFLGFRVRGLLALWFSGYGVFGPLGVLGFRVLGVVRLEGF